MQVSDLRPLDVVSRPCNELFLIIIIIHSIVVGNRRFQSRNDIITRQMNHLHQCKHGGTHKLTYRASHRSATDSSSSYKILAWRKQAQLPCWLCLNCSVSQSVSQSVNQPDMRKPASWRPYHLSSRIDKTANATVRNRTPHPMKQRSPHDLLRMFCMPESMVLSCSQFSAGV
jgi:hypothetical protein